MPSVFAFKTIHSGNVATWKNAKSDFRKSNFLKSMKIPDVFRNIKVLNFMKFVRVFGDAEKLGLPGIRFFGFLGVELDVALDKLGFVGSNTSANFNI